MAGVGNGVGLMMMGACFALVLQSALAVTYTVGDGTGWTIPTNTQLYTTWVTGKTFKVGDQLVFNFQNGSHDVMQVTKTNYDSCGKSNSLFLESNPPVKITLNTTGSHYYICSVGAHCQSGQKVTITVAASTPTTSPSPSPAAAKSPPPSATSSPPPSATPPSESTPGSASSPPTTAGPSPPASGPASSQAPPPGDNSSADRLTASLGILSGVAALFFL